MIFAIVFLKITVKYIFFYIFNIALEKGGEIYYNYKDKTNRKTGKMKNQRLKNFLKRNKIKIINIILTVLILTVISLLSSVVLCSLGIIYFEDGMKLNTELFLSFTGSWYGWILILLLQVVLTVLLSFVPGFSMAFIILVSQLFEHSWQAVLVAFTGVMMSSFIMYLMGRFGGYKLCQALLGEKDCAKASELLNNKGAVYFPLMMMFPMFPDDAIVMIAGTLRMSLKWFIPSIVIGRGIGILTIIFGLVSVPYEKFTTPWHWVGFFLTCAVFLVAVFYMAYRFNKFLEKKQNKD